LHRENLALPKLLKHIGRFFCMLLVLQIFILTAHADDIDDDEFTIEQGVTVISAPNHHTEFFTDQIVHPRKDTHVHQEHHNKKYQIGKHISVQSIVTKTPEFHFHSFYESIVHTPSVPKNYRYTFFREINPPPPKFC